MTGGGFGGAAIAIMPQDRVASALRNMRRRYRTPDGEEPVIMVERAETGAVILSS